MVVPAPRPLSSLPARLAHTSKHQLEKNSFCQFSFLKQLLTVKCQGRRKARSGQQRGETTSFTTTWHPEPTSWLLLLRNLLFSRWAAIRAPRREVKTLSQPQSSRWNKLMYFLLSSKAAVSASTAGCRGRGGNVPSWRPGTPLPRTACAHLAALSEHRRAALN